MSAIKRLLFMSGACGVLAASISNVLAQEASSEGVSEVVIVTGSYIRGSAEDAALPIDVISAEDLEKSGSPSTVDLLKNLSVSSGALGDSNQFAAGAQGTEGSGSVSLRNLGRQRTLVLLNGRRLVNGPALGSPDTNLIPAAAIGRIEVLKDGAAATYGSDAIGGVVNFITNDRLDGFEIGGNYEYIDDTDGDYDTRLSFGWQGDGSSFLISGSYQHRSELRVADRSFAVSDFLENPQSFSSGGNPGTLGIVNPANPALSPVFRDPNCAVLGGVPGTTDGNPQSTPPGPPAPTCYFQFAPFDNLVEEQDQYQVYTEYNVEFGETTKLHLEAFYSETDIPEYRTSPSFLPTQTPSAGAGPGNTAVPGRFSVPTFNPGIQDLIRQNPAFIASLPAAVQANLASPMGQALDVNPLFRPFGVGGNPLTGGANISDRNSDAFRVSATLKGDVTDSIKYDVGLTYMENNFLTTNNDILVTRFQAALKGLGGFNCTGNTPGQNGCLFYNPYSSAIERNAITGQVNPNFVAANANTPELADYLFENNDLDRKTTLVVADAVLSGESGIELPGGAVGWAAGAQFRESDFKSRYSTFANYDINPCVNLGDMSCLTPGGAARNPALATGAFFFLGGGFDQDVSQNVYALFGEVSLPIFESFSAQVAVRYEDYGGDVGDTVDPKLSLRYQLTDSIALRGSIGTSFRGPPETSLVSDSQTQLSFLTQAGGFRSIRIFGNPDLEPESATTFNLGLLFNFGGFRGSIDYFNYDFEDPFIAEDFSAIVGEVFKSGGANCASPVASRIIFQGGVACAQGAQASTIGSVVTNIINGPGIETDGIDVDMQYTFNDVLGGSLGLGLNATYVLGFDVGALMVEGVQVSSAFDGAGFSNVNTGYTPLPELKGNMFIEYNRGSHNLRLTNRYIDSYIDSRSLFVNDPTRNIFLPRPSTMGQAITKGRRIDSFVTQDLTYVLQLPANTTFSASVSNLTDEDPPFARLELSYDPSVVSPVGRTIEVGFRKKF